MTDSETKLELAKIVNRGKVTVRGGWVSVRCATEDDAGRAVELLRQLGRRNPQRFHASVVTWGAS